MLSFPEPRYMPCNECGASVARVESAAHACEEDRRLDFLMFHHRNEIDAFDDELSRYLDSPHGRFSAWDAERRR